MHNGDHDESPEWSGFSQWASDDACVVKWRQSGLRPAGSDPRVGDGLVWNPIPMAFEYIFLDRMQRF